LAAKNCSECPYNNYDADKSKELGHLIPNIETESKNFTTALFEDSLMFNGSFVKDILTPYDELARNFSYQKNSSFEFFLIHNVTGEPDDIKSMKNKMNDGYLGMPSGLSENRTSFLQ
jgi:hypothetical protein